MDAMLYCLALDPPLTKLANAPAGDDASGASAAQNRDPRGTNNRNYIREVSLLAGPARWGWVASRIGGDMVIREARGRVG
jgi:hypothetical protein